MVQFGRTGVTADRSGRYETSVILGSAPLPPASPTPRQRREQLFGPQLPDNVGLFERGALADTTNLPHFVMRVNRHLFVHAMGPRGYSRLDLKSAIKPDGQLAPHAELLVFGAWLADGMLGRSSRRGRVPNPFKLVKFVAAGFSALNERQRAPAVQSLASSHIRTANIVMFWERCFDERSSTSDHSSALRSLRSIVPDYMAHLAAGGLKFNGCGVTASPLMTKLAAALRPSKTSAGVSDRAAVTPASSATSATRASPQIVPAVFEVPLTYSSKESLDEYRNLGPTGPPLPSLRYDVLPVVPTPGHPTARRDREGRLVLRPDLEVKKLISARALIDRIAFTVSTTSITSSTTLKKAMEKTRTTCQRR